MGWRVAVLGLGVVWGGAAAADEAPLSLMLSCAGTDTTVQQTGEQTTVTVTQAKPSAPMAPTPNRLFADDAARPRTTTSTQTTPVYSSVRVSARMSVAIQGGAVRLRPPEYSAPGGRRASTDGWYDMSDVEITDTLILARATWGGFLTGKYRLKIDRRTGDATFGDFSGVCEKSAVGPEERKF